MAKIHISHFLLAVAIVSVVLISGCVGQAPDGTQTITTDTQQMSVEIISRDCKILTEKLVTGPGWSRREGTIVFRVTGTGSGPVNTELWLSGSQQASTMEDPGELDCGSWTRKPNTYAFDCIRMEGDPEKTTWIVTSVTSRVSDLDRIKETYSNPARAEVYCPWESCSNYNPRDEYGEPYSIKAFKYEFYCSTDDFPAFAPTIY